MPDWSSINQQLTDSGIEVLPDAVGRPVSGGDISAAWRLSTRGGDLFIKTGPPSAHDMFTAEAAGLAEIAGTGAIKVPNVIAVGRGEPAEFLALEWIDFERADAGVEERFGRQLAELHRASSDRFGWHRDNTIGLTPQINKWTNDWLSFFRDQRLAYQFQLAAANGFTGELQVRGARLLKRLPVYFEHEISPSLLHGDLWAGNWACSAGEAVIFDPAVYFGDRESDIAMTHLFGGFGQAFYDSYESSWPLPDGHRERQRLYQLYHVLNHLNLFGSAYLGRAERLINELL